MRGRALGVFLVIVAGLVALPSPRHGKAEAAGTDTSKHFELFSDVLAKVRANYVVQTDDSKLLEDAIKGVLTEVDQTRGGPIALPLPRQSVAFADVLAQMRTNYAVKTDNSKLVNNTMPADRAGACLRAIP